jgi:putative methyltransferase (TIGR04325 family)
MNRQQLKQWAEYWLPPMMLSIYRRWWGIRFSGSYDSWADALEHSTGYDSELIFENVRSAILKVRSGQAAYERDSVLFYKQEHPFSLLAGLMRSALDNEGNLCVLDFGGALGSSYYQCRDFLSNLNSLKWCIVEQDKFVKMGRESFETDQLRFFFSVAECLKAEQPNTILFSSVLQYIPHPFEALLEAVNSKADYIIFDRLQLSGSERDSICVQYVPARIYLASYPCWIFSEENFKKSMSDQFELISEADSLNGCRGEIGGLAFYNKDMIWRRRQNRPLVDQERPSNVLP